MSNEYELDLHNACVQLSEHMKSKDSYTGGMMIQEFILSLDEEPTIKMALAKAKNVYNSEYLEDQEKAIEETLEEDHF